MTISGNTYLMMVDDDVLAQLNDPHTAPAVQQCLANMVSQSVEDEANTTELDTSSSSSVDLGQKKEKKNWSEDGAKLLMFHRSLMHEEFESGRTTGHEALWGTVAKELIAAGYCVTAAQCDNKFKALKRMYNKVVDHNKITGNDKKTCKFYDDMDKLFGCKASTNPRCTINTVRSNPGEKNDHDEKMKRNNSDDEAGVTRTKRKKKVSRSNNDTSEWLKSYADSQKVAEEKRLTAIENMHKEIMTLFKNLDKLN